MNIQTFIDLCDRVDARSTTLEKLTADDAYRALSDAARGSEREVRSTLFALKKYLAIRYENGSSQKQPYLSILAVMQDAIRDEGPAIANPSFAWEQLIELVLSAKDSLHWFHPGQGAKFSDEEFALAKACLRLNHIGVEICEENNEVRISPTSYPLIEAEISRLASIVGGDGILNRIFSSLQPQYHQPFGRYLFGRKVSSGSTRISPAVPWGYLIALGVKHLTSRIAKNKDSDFLELTSLVTDVITVFEIQPYSVWTNLLFGPNQLVSLLQKTVLYDNLIAVQQINGRHAKLILSYLTKPFIEAGHSSQTVRLKDAVKLGLAIIELSNTKHQRFVTAELLSKNTGLRKYIVENSLKNVFAFEQGIANHSLTFPPSSSEIDSSFRPLFKAGVRYRLLPRSLASLGVVNAVLNMISKPDGIFSTEFDRRLGDVLEHFIRERINAAGISVYTGDIQSASRDRVGECDALIDTSRGLLIFEVKKKGLTRKAMAGSDVDLLVDLAQSLMKAQEQAYRIESYLIQQGEISLKSKNGEDATISLNGREIEKVSVSLTDFGGFQSRAFLQRILDNAIRANLSASNAKDDKRLEDWRRTVAALRQYVANENTDRPFSNSLFLSVPQILTLLERIEAADQFFDEVLLGKNMIYGLQDFYSEYAQTLKMLNI